MEDLLDSETFELSLKLLDENHLESTYLSEGEIPMFINGSLLMGGVPVLSR